MTTSAWVLMITTWAVVAGMAGWFFWRVAGAERKAQAPPSPKASR